MFVKDALTRETLFEDSFQFACPPDHPLGNRSEIKNTDIRDQSLLLLEEGHCLRGHALNACHARQTGARVDFEATSLTTLIQMTAQGLGVTLLPRIAIDANVTAGTNIRLIPLASGESRHIGLVWRATSPRTEEFELLADLIRRHPS